MLVLSRKSGESVVIGGKITVTVIESRGEIVRLGIEAPKEVPVHRWEVFERIRAERANAKGLPIEQITAAEIAKAQIPIVQIPLPQISTAQITTVEISAVEISAVEASDECVSAVRK